MTVAVQTVIRLPLRSSLTPRYLSGFDNNWPFRHFIGRFAFAHLPYSHLTVSNSLFFYRFMCLCFLKHIIEVVWLILLKIPTGRPASIFITVALLAQLAAHIEMTGDSDVKAVFEQITYPLTINIVGNGAVQYDITEGGQIEPTDINLCSDATCVIDVPEFSEVELNPIPAEGWVFDNWDFDPDDRSNTVSKYMVEPVTATATFIPDPYAVQTIVEPAGSGSVDVDPPGPYDLGSTVTFTASPSENFLGWDWVGNATEVMQRSGSSGNNPLVIILGGPVTVTGNFALMAVPISNWAIIVGLALIIGFIAFRFRHLV